VTDSRSKLYCENEEYISDKSIVCLLRVTSCYRSALTCFSGPRNTHTDLIRSSVLTAWRSSRCNQIFTGQTGVTLAVSCNSKVAQGRKTQTSAQANWDASESTLLNITFMMIRCSSSV